MSLIIRPPTGSMTSHTQVNLWLNLLNNSKRQLLSVYPLEFKRLRSIAPIQPERVIKSRDGEPMIFMIDRLETIEVLKRIYGFLTKSEASKQVTDASTDES